MVGSFSNICYLIKPLINKSAFYKQLRKDNNKSLLPDFFANGIILLVKRIILVNYMNNS